MDYFSLPSRLPNALFSLALRILRRLDVILCAVTARTPNAGWHFPDWFSTPHNKSFFVESRFQSSYQKSIEVVGLDYRIPWRIHQALWAADSTASLDGDIVEVGTGRGFVMAAVAEWVSDLDSFRNKKIWLFDKFELPAEVDEKKYSLRQYYTSSADSVISSFAQWPFVNVVVGDVFETLGPKAPDKISFLHLDLNDATAECWVLEKLWTALVPGAIVLLDDYANRGLEDQYQAINEFLEPKGKVALTTASGQGIVIR